MCVYVYVCMLVCVCVCVCVCVYTLRKRFGLIYIVRENPQPATFFALFQFSLTYKIASIQNAGLSNTKYKNTLSDKHNNTLYMVNTNRLNIFTLILHNIFKILKRT